jgi:hypothetical protein
MRPGTLPALSFSWVPHQAKSAALHGAMVCSERWGVFRQSAGGKSRHAKRQHPAAQANRNIPKAMSDAGMARLGVSQMLKRLDGKGVRCHPPKEAGAYRLNV